MSTGEKGKEVESQKGVKVTGLTGRVPGRIAVQTVVDGRRWNGADD